MKTNLKLVTSNCFIAIVFFNVPFLSLAQERVSITPGIQTEANIPGDIFNDSLARLPLVQRSNLDAQGRRAFDTYVSPGTGYETGLRGPVGMWMHSPNLARGVFDVRQRVRYGTPKD